MVTFTFQNKINFIISPKYRYRSIRCTDVPVIYISDYFSKVLVKVTKTFFGYNNQRIALYYYIGKSNFALSTEGIYDNNGIANKIIEELITFRLPEVCMLLKSVRKFSKFKVYNLL